jgi:hypothetical protein
VAAGLSTAGKINTSYVVAYSSVTTSTGVGMFDVSTDLGVGDYNSIGKNLRLYSSGVEYMTIGGGTNQFKISTMYNTPGAGSAIGELVFYGTGTSLTPGYLYYLNSSGVWTQTLASSVNSSKYLLAIATGTNATSGMLIRGFARFAGVGNYSTVTTGQILYLGTTLSYFQSTPVPSGTGVVVRIIGYCVDSTNSIIYFNPDNTWVELA